MSDVMIAKSSDSKFKPHPEGQYVGQCVELINLGMKVQDFPGTTPYLAQTCALVFRTGEKNDETGDYIDIAREFTVTMGEKANLRKFLEQWRGKPYTTEQIEEGVALHKLEGNHGLLTVAHRTSGKGRAYANITACVGIPKQMAGSVTKYDDYQRAEYWETKKKEYADAAAKFRGESANGPGIDYNDFPEQAPDDDSDLPF
jgi:hypothetical protein